MKSEKTKPNDTMTADAWEPFEKEGSPLRGHFNVHLPSGLTICGMGYFEKGKARWCAPPVQSLKKKDGSQGFKRIVEFRDDRTEQNFKCQCLDALDKLLVEIQKPKPETDEEPVY